MAKTSNNINQKNNNKMRKFIAINNLKMKIFNPNFLKLIPSYSNMQKDWKDVFLKMLNQLLPLTRFGDSTGLFSNKTMLLSG